MRSAFVIILSLSLFFICLLFFCFLFFLCLLRLKSLFYTGILSVSSIHLHLSVLLLLSFFLYHSSFLTPSLSFLVYLFINLMFAGHFIFSSLSSTFPSLIYHLNVCHFNGVLIIDL